MLHTVKKIFLRDLSVQFGVWKANKTPKSGLGRRGASSSNSKESGPTQTQSTDSRRPDSQNGNRSDAQVKAETIDVPSLLWYQYL
jgi:hypothetical protein